MFLHEQHAHRGEGRHRRHERSSSLKDKPDDQRDDDAAELPEPGRESGCRACKGRTGGFRDHYRQQRAVDEDTDAQSEKNQVAV